MEAAVRIAVPVGLVRFADRPSTYAPFVKLTYQLRASGWATFARDQVPVSNGEVQGGVVLFPSDFSETKRSCEVALVGSNLAARSGPIRVTVGPLVLEAEKPADLLPIALGGQKSAFAHDDARLPFPTLPLSILIEGAGPTLRSAIPVPGPEMALVIGGVWAAPRPVRTMIDAILIDLERGECTTIHRGFFQQPGNVDEATCLVVEPSGKLANAEREMQWWTRLPVARPAVAPAATAERTRPQRPAFPRRAKDDEVSRTMQLALPVTTKKPASTVPPPEVEADDVEPVTPRARAAPPDDATVERPRMPATEPPPPSSKASEATLRAGVTLVDPGTDEDETGDDEERITERPPPLPPPEPAAAALESRTTQLNMRSVDSATNPLPFLQGLVEAPARGTRPPPPPRRHDPEERTALFQLPPAEPAAALPFTTGPHAPTPPATRAEPSERRRSGDTLPPPAEATAPPTMAWAPPLRSLGEPGAALDLRAGQPPPPLQTLETAGAKSQGMTLDDYVRVRVELWGGARPRGEILKAHGLSELKWRVAQRKWSQAIDAMGSDPDKILPVVARFQRVAEASPT